MAINSRLSGRTALFAVATVAALTGAPTAASAQFQVFGGPFYHSFSYRTHFFRPHVYQPPVLEEELSPRAILGAVHRQGFRNASRPVYREDVALVTATDRQGRRARLSVDTFTGRIVDLQPLAPERRERLAQRAPGEGAAVRRAVPDNRRETSAPAERSPAPRPPTTVRREPMLPPQPQQATPPRPPVTRPPTAEAAPVQPGTRAAPRRIDVVPPPAALDDVRPPTVAPSGPPINSVPPAALE
jgi:hypothetical protein